jgi:glycosyltransferase involved in cell wall biosynthesis
MRLLLITQKVNDKDQLLGFFIPWIKKFALKFDKITVLCLEKGEFSLPENVRVISLGKDKGASKVRQLFTFYFLIFRLRSDYDAVFVHMNPIWTVLGGPSWKMMHKKIFFWYTHKAVTSKLKMAEKFADVIFTASKESFRLPSRKVIVTGHGINTEFFRPEPAKLNTTKKLKLLSVGRIAPVKNYETLIDAAKLLKQKEMDFLVTMVGEAPLERDKKYENSLRFKIKSLKLEENFEFMGKVNHQNLVPYYRSNDIFIHLSKTGSVDKTLLEAMACGMKVLSSNDSSKAFLSKSLIFDQDDPRELAEKIQMLNHGQYDPSLREYVINNHNLDNLIDKLSKFIIG